MLLKTKFLVSIVSVGVAGGTGAGLYYSVTKTNTDSKDGNDKKDLPEDRNDDADASNDLLGEYD